MGLQRYIEKRNFRATPEPKGRPHSAKPRALSFVIQKHDATRLHYDFRLEMEGVLKSWAVPKGVPARKGEKRLAMHVEDHPLEYGGFEGIIPEGNYGAGTVMLWDRGTYEVLGGEALENYQKGKIHFRLRGKKLEGEWTLVRMRGREEPGKEPWLLIKSGEDIKPMGAKADDQSVLSRKTMEQIAHRRAKVWLSNRDAKEPVKKATERPAAARRKRLRPRAASDEESEAARDELIATLDRFPRETAGYVEPMKALLVETAPKGPGWLYEIKWDGYRAIAVKEKERVRLFSRRGRELTTEFADIAEAVRQIPVATLVLDGEIVATDGRGHASFQLLQNYRQGGGAGLRYYIFDLLNIENRDLKQLALERRKLILETLLQEIPKPIFYSASLKGNPDVLLEKARKNRIEGLVGKRVDSVYEPGRRSGAWIKIKISLEQEFVIGGYTEPGGSRPYFGSVLVGYYEGGKLMFSARVGTGFDTKTLKALHTHFQTIRTETYPFSNVPSQRHGRFGTGLTRAEMKRCTWLKPVLVCQVRFAEWTDDGGLRHPVFLGLRDDISPEEARREIAAKVR